MPSLLLVRHAIAEARGDSWPDDALRPLSKKGKARMQRIAERLMAIGEIAPVVLTSPLARAVATARILADNWNPTPRVVVTAALAPGFSPAATAAALGGGLTGARVALVGHEPGLGEFAAWLTGAQIPVPFKKGGAARIDAVSPLRPGCGQLVWLVTPKLVRAGD